MAKYIITCEHEAADCEQMDRELQATGMPAIMRGRDFHCSCPYGYHAGWIAVEGTSPEQALEGLASLPTFQSHARVYQIETAVF